MEKTPENPINLFSRAVAAMSRWAEQGKPAEEKPVFDWSHFSLDNLAACFAGADEKKFLTDAPLEAFLSELDPVDFALHEVVPEGIRITPCVLPCDANGLPLPPQYLDDSTNQVYPYFQLFYSNPSNNSGMAVCSGKTRSAPYLLAIPEEIRVQCSFVVEYKAGNERREGESDYVYFTRVLRDRYKRLQELLKGRL
jgi:hypothetical protein